MAAQRSAVQQEVEQSTSKLRQEAATHAATTQVCALLQTPQQCGQTYMSRKGARTANLQLSHHSIYPSCAYCPAAPAMLQLDNMQKRNSAVVGGLQAEVALSRPLRVEIL